MDRRGFNLRRLRDYRHVYQVYPSLGVEIIKYLESNSSWLANNKQFSIRLFSTAKLQASDNQTDEKLRLPTAKFAKEEWHTPADRLF